MWDVKTLHVMLRKNPISGSKHHEGKSIDAHEGDGSSCIYDSVDLLASQKNWHNILCVMFEHNATWCVLIFKIGVNQQSHLYETPSLGRANPTNDIAFIQSLFLKS